MARDPEPIVRAILDRHGRTFSEEIGLRVERGTPAALFGLLCASMLMSARIGHGISIEASRAVVRRWSTARRLDASTWEQRVDALHAAGYTRYQERTATMLGEVAQAALKRYGGDLRRLRDEAEREPKAERRLLKGFKGVGDVGADIFLREVQATWDEVFPFADRRARQAARRLGLPGDPDALAELTSRKDLPRLVAGLVRVQLEDDFDGVRRRVPSHQ
jgi:endonuclease III